MSRDVAVKVGIWNGAATGERGKLLYRVLIADAIAQGIRGGTVWRNVEGSRSNRAFRTVESEVASNELPLWLEFMDDEDSVSLWLPEVVKTICDRGVVLLQSVISLRPAPPGRTGKGRADAMESGTRPVQSTLSNTPGILIQLYTLERNQIAGKPVYQAVAEFLRSRSVLWISTTRGVCGYGETKQMHRSNWLKRNDVPIVMNIVDNAPKIEALLPDLIEFAGRNAYIVSSHVSIHCP